MAAHHYALWIDGARRETPDRREIVSPYSGQVVASASQAGHSDVEDTLAATARAFEEYRRVSRGLRGRLLEAMAVGLQARRAELVERIALEAGKPRDLADGEVGRAVLTFRLAADEARRLGGEIVPVDQDSAGSAFLPASVSWVPRGPALAITPFNFPLNLVAHKVAPCLAAGSTVILKPPPQAPGAAMILVEVFEEARKEVSGAQERVPAAAMQVVHGSNDAVGRAIADPRVRTVSFTGSHQGGLAVQRLALGKNVVLELGGNAAVIVHSGLTDAELAFAADRCAFGGYAYAGQVCISVQRVFVHRAAGVRFRELFLSAISRLKVGDPLEAGVVVGPLVDAGAADRVCAWIDEARAGGAKVLMGGAEQRSGRYVPPTLLEGAPRHSRIVAEEVFGPVVVIEDYDDFAEAVRLANDSRYGLQAGVFTRDAALVQQAIERLEVGGILVNDVPTYRADAMAYGGFKDSGLGREGPRFAIEHYSERKTVLQRRL